ncbi:hypothetical protein [Sneathiella limimaris]|uniref:hypothetical protein n=1 Tax=Sneathiella limimaris TaxID=1964213 RepID=UPI001469D11D|nr:hypothetical protein [Sneathiella limimaris]
MTRYLVLILLCLAPGLASATINSVTTTPSSVAIPVTGSARVTVTWIVNRTSAAGRVVPVTSANAELRIGGVLITNLAGSLSATSSVGVGVTDILQFTETYTLTPAQTSEIAKASAGSVSVRRIFTDTENTVIGTLNVGAGASNSGDLSLRRIELSFENTSKTDVVRQGERQRAVAEISFRSSGLIKGEWRLADPSSTNGSSRYRVLQVVRQQLVSSGQGRTRIVSPPLPTNKIGLYLVTFVAEDGDDSLEFPVLRYFVLQGQQGVAQENLETYTPAEGAAVSPNTVFSWPVVPNAFAYQVEILEKGKADVVSGKLVKAEDLSLSLESFSIDHLEAGKVYDWRLRAFGAGGQVIGVSPRKTLYVP